MSKVCVFIYMHKNNICQCMFYIYVCLLTYIGRNTYTHICIHSCTHRLIWSIYMPKHSYSIYTYMHASIHAYIHTVCNMFIYLHTCTHICAWTSAYVHVFRYANVHTYACMYVICVCMHIQRYMSAYIHICINTLIYAYTDSCMSAYTHTCILFYSIFIYPYIYTYILVKLHNIAVIVVQ